MKSTLRLLISVFIIVIAIIFEDVFIYSILSSFLIALIIFIAAIAVYILSLTALIIGWKKQDKKPKHIELILHLIFVIFLTGYYVSKTELVKSTPIMVAETTDIWDRYRLVLRKNGDSEFQHLMSDKKLLWKYTGTYKIIGDTIKMDIIPYKMIIRADELWYLDVKDTDYNRMDTVLMNIISVDFK